MTLASMKGFRLINEKKQRKGLTKEKVCFLLQYCFINMAKEAWRNLLELL